MKWKQNKKWHEDNILHAISYLLLQFPSKTNIIGNVLNIVRILKGELHVSFKRT
ncbi:hypothetical protein [Sporosarcina sp. FA9]|uniref:hypothetical protein n=1 Tax=Sporosarcina sp. FA9 TaxID=3413030 RepID=UPI003F65E3E6